MSKTKQNSVVIERKKTALSHGFRAAFQPAIGDGRIPDFQVRPGAVITDKGDLIDAHEAAKILKVTTGTLNNWRSMGIGPAYVKIGDGPRGNVRYNRETVKAFAKGMRRKLARG